MSNCAQPMKQPHALPASHTGSLTSKARGAIRPLPPVASSTEAADKPASPAGFRRFCTCNHCALEHHRHGWRSSKSALPPRHSRECRRADKGMWRTTCATGWKPNSSVALQAGTTAQLLASPDLKAPPRSCAHAHSECPAAGWQHLATAHQQQERSRREGDHRPWQHGLQPTRETQGLHTTTFGMTLCRPSLQARSADLHKDACACDAEQVEPAAPHRLLPSSVRQPAGYAKERKRSACDAERSHGNKDGRRRAACQKSLQTA